MSQPQQPQQPYVSIRDLRFRYPGSPEDVLRIPILTISGRGVIALTGPSGAGKSTLVELLAGTLREPYEGSVQVLGTELKTLTRDADRQRHMRRVGLIPQDYGLLPGMTVEDILRQDLADAEVPKAEHAERTRWALAQVDLTEFAQRRSERLSGGQRQRVAIARMLARDVDLVIADEPTANLDPELVGETVHLLRRLAGRMPVIVVTHDARVVEQCDRTIVLQATASTAPAEAAPAGAAHAIPLGVALNVRSSLLLAALIVALVVLGTGGASLAWHRALSPRSGASHTATSGTPTVQDISLAMTTTVAISASGPNCPFKPFSNPITISDGRGGTLTGVVGVCSTTTADVGIQLVFFWHNATFLGWDSNRAAAVIEDLKSPGSGVFAVTYPHYAPDDPFCCPSLPAVTILYRWNGSGFSANGTPPAAETTPIKQTGGTPAKAFTTIGSSPTPTSSGTTPQGFKLVSDQSVGYEYQPQSDWWIAFSCVPESDPHGSLAVRVLGGASGQPVDFGLFPCNSVFQMFAVRSDNSMVEMCEDSDFGVPATPLPGYSGPGTLCQIGAVKWTLITPIQVQSGPFGWG